MITYANVKELPTAQIPPSIEAQTHILVIDDEPEIGSFITRLLVSLGYTVSLATSAQAALDFMNHRIPDLIITDIMMPGQDGLHLCKQLREDRRTWLTPIVILSALGDPQNRLNGFRAGADDYIVKPFDVLEVKARVESILRRSQRDLWCNPLTHLPASPGIADEVNSCLDKNIPFAFAYIDIDNFKSYNDAYGYHAGDQVIKDVAAMLLETVRTADPQEGFIGHIGGDDFAILTKPEKMKDILDAIVNHFDASVGNFYSSADLAKNGILTKNRQGVMQFFPLMRLSIGVVNTLTRPIHHYAQLASVASEVKRRAKSDEHPNRSRYLWDCRS